MTTNPVNSKDTKSNSDDSTKIIKSPAESKPSIDEKKEVPLSEMEWDEIAEIFDSLKGNLDKLFFFFYSIVASKDVCKENPKCTIPDNLRKLNWRRMDFQYKTKEQAKSKLSEFDYGQFCEEFDSFVLEAWDLFNQMCFAEAKEQTTFHKEDVYHQRNLETIDHLATMEHPPVLELGRDLSGILRAQSHLSGASDQVRANMEKIEKEDRDKEKVEKEKRKQKDQEEEDK